MAIEAKVNLMRALERQLAEQITAADMARVLETVSDQLAGYDVTQIEGGPAEKDDLLEAYLTALRIQGRSEKTVVRYGYIIGRLMTALGVPTRDITVYHLRRFLADEKARGISDRTLEGNRQVFSAYFNWLQREGLIASNPTGNLGAIKYAKKIKEVYSEVDLEALKDACEDPRDRALVAILAATGCRVSEICRLDRADVDLVKLECTVLGKGNKERTVFLTPVAALHLKNYLRSRDDADPALFLSRRRRERLQPCGVQYILKKLSEAAHVAHVHPHKFRRTLATKLIRHGMPIQEVASILGHDKLDTTMEYVVLDKTDVRNAYRKFA